MDSQPALRTRLQHHRADREARIQGPQVFRHRHHDDPQRHGTLLPCCAAARKRLPRYSLPPPSLVAQTWTRLREMAAGRRLSDQNGRAGSCDARQSSPKCRGNNHRSAASATDSDPHVSPPTHHGRATIATRRTGLGVGR